MKEKDQKALKKLALFFFRTQSLLMDKVIKNKMGLELVTSRYSGHKTSSEKFFYLLYIIWLSLTMYCKAVFELFQKLHRQIYTSQFMAINYSTSICPLESGKCGKEGKKSQTCEYLDNEKSFLDEMKNIFHSF